MLAVGMRSRSPVYAKDRGVLTSVHCTTVVVPIPKSNRFLPVADRILQPENVGKELGHRKTAGGGY
jgi:hypothetical protein